MKYNDMAHLIHLRESPFQHKSCGVSLRSSGDEAGTEGATSASPDDGSGANTFLPHLSLVGAVQSRQLGEFLDGKGEPG